VADQEGELVRDERILNRQGGGEKALARKPVGADQRWQDQAQQYGTDHEM
jgi:hypothetical protein